jgi:hypothetical protein
MSEFWDFYKKRVEEGAVKLSPRPNEVDQNILWLKAYVQEKFSNEGYHRHVGEAGTDSFGFTEKYVNYLMHYAYEAGMKARDHQFKESTNKMHTALDKIYDVLEEVGWVENSGW